MSPQKSTILAGDIGGTKVNLGLFEPGKTRPRLRVIETYKSLEFPKLEELVQAFLSRHHRRISGGCFAIAGPVQGEESRTTNLPWFVSARRLRARFGWPCVRLINDLTAIARAIPLLDSRELVTLNRRRSRKGRPVAVIAPGTGLGQAIMAFSENRPVLIPSEGGHVDFAPNSDEEISLWRFLRRRTGHVSIERILSGPGIYNIYTWLKRSGRYREPAWLRRKIRGSDPPKVITEAAMVDRQPLCRGTLEIFIRILGAASGNLALTTLSTGGLYLAGGIPPKILPALHEGRFMEAFVNKGRFRGLLEKIPVRVVLNERAALIGAARYLLTS